MLRWLSLVLALVAVLGCSKSGGPPDGGPDGYPDPSFIFQVKTHVQTATDEPFLQERSTLFRTTDVLPVLDVRAVAVVGTRVWVGTQAGLFVFNEGSGKFVAEPFVSGPQPTVVDIARQTTSDDRLVFALPNAVVLRTYGGEMQATVDIPATVTSVASAGAGAWAGTESGLYRVSLTSADRVTEVGTLAIRDLDVDGRGALWMATEAGLVKWDGSQLSTFKAAEGKLADDDVRAVFGLEAGGVWAGTAKGAARVGTSADTVWLPGPGSLPGDDITSLWAQGDLVFFGHGIGATLVQGDLAKVDHYHSQRWIPAETVTAVALQADGTRWIATSAGIARIALEPNTLAEKAARFETLNEKFWRLDFVSCEGNLADPWQPEGRLQHWDHDNDGLWTQMQVAAWSFAAAASGDRTYCQKARRAMRGMMRLIDIPAVSFQAIGRERGFVARSFVRDDEGDVYASKAGSDRWVLVENFAGEGHDYYWKNDTSSDETTGHFFGYPLYFDFCADAAERVELADHLGALARTIVEHDFYLVDMDGEPTTWGHWGLETLPIALDGVSECQKNYPFDKCLSAAYGGGWLNAIEILGHLLAAYHLTGDPVFYDGYRFLLRNRYAELVDFSENVWTVTNRTIANHSDHELAMLAYHTLIRYEPDEALRERWITSLLGMYQYEIPERNPLWAAVVAGFVSEGYHLADALETLRVWPEDWREWLVDNSHRKDAVLDVAGRHGEEQFTTVLPYDEIRTMKWNGNPYAVRDGGDGRTVQAPWPWLLPYWMFRYHGVITAP